MSGKSESGRPLAPEGFSKEEASDARQLVLYQGPEPQIKRLSTPSAIIGLAWCVVGGVWASTEVMLTCALVGYGASISSWGRSSVWNLLALASAIAAALVGCLVLDNVPYLLPGAILSVVLACAIATLRCKQRLSGPVLLIAAALAGAALMGIDLTQAALQGESLTAGLLSVVDETSKNLRGSVDADVYELMNITRMLIRDYWPTIYVVTAACMTFAAHIGAALAARLHGEKKLAWLAELDLPLACALVFAVAVAAQLLGGQLPVWGEQVSFVGANLLMLMRLALALQGLGVVSWHLSKRGSGFFTKTFAMLLALWLEASFVVMCVVGLLDMATNLRRITRRRKSLVSWPETEG